MPKLPPLHPDNLSQELERILSLSHHDPHGVLGIHLTSGGVVIRSYRPEAEKIRVLIQGREPVEMDRLHENGIFQAIFRYDDQPFPYQLEVSYPGGATFTIRDPYAFLPTLGDLDLHLAQEGLHQGLHHKLGAHPQTLDGVPGVSFAVWAPTAQSVSVVGEFNRWDGRLHAMRHLKASGFWEIFIPDTGDGTEYLYEITPQVGVRFLKMDPYGFATRPPPAMMSVVFSSRYKWKDTRWLQERKKRNALTSAMNIYEVHMGSWRRVAEEKDRSLTYAELARELPAYVKEMGFSHVELLPPAEHPFGGSWGYQVSNYFSPTARYGSPDDLRLLIDAFHEAGIGVIIDWVPAHFPKDEKALALFDGTALYEHLDPRQGSHPDWGTLVFNYGRPEVKNFLIDNALFWIDEYHVDGLRVDAVASMLYLDYSRKDGEWVANKFGGRENLEAIDFMKELNDAVRDRYPGVMVIAEESTSWPMVSRPTHLGGLGFNLKWNMGWMHDNLEYFSRDPLFRKFIHTKLTFGMFYAYSENFILPLSHDEVVHMKGSLLGKMPGDGWLKFANLRAMLAYMWGHPGKKLLFMGAELGQIREWNHDGSLDWHLLEDPAHAGMHLLMRDLNRLYRTEPAFWEADFDPVGFKWIDVNNADENVVAFIRFDAKGGKPIIGVANFAPVLRESFRIGVPGRGMYREVLNTDAECYGGSNEGNSGQVKAKPVSSHGHDWCLDVKLPPLSVIYLKPEAPEPEAPEEFRPIRSLVPYEEVEEEVEEDNGEEPSSNAPPPPTKKPARKRQATRKPAAKKPAPAKKRPARKK